MKLIVGLGNPGIQYERTRHNAGFLCLSGLSLKLSFEFEQKRNLHCRLAKLKLKQEDVLFVKPETYMNRSGESVAAVISWYKIDTNEVLVVHDDVSLPLGKLRFQRGGGAGGQHGVESIIECLGGRNTFDRLKIGVGPDPGGQRRADYVLSPVPNTDVAVFDYEITIAQEAACFWLERGIQESMNRYNGLDLSLSDQPSKLAE